MDPLTQAALGAVVGQVCAGRRVGYRRSAAWGAIAGAFPDLDSVLVGALSDDRLVRLVHHRGLTHSVFFAPLLGPLWGSLLWRRAREGPSPWAWIVLITAALWSHPLLDLCTHYGTQLLLPFSDRRFALPAIPVVEPLYTLMLCVGGTIAWRSSTRWASRAAAAALSLSTGYLLYGLKINSDAEAWARRDLQSRGIAAQEIHAFPTLLQLPYRRLLARTPSEDRVGFVSMAKPCAVEWVSRARAEGASERRLRDTREGRIFEWFASGLTAASSDGSRAFVTDLRYGFGRDVLAGNWRLEAALDASTGEPMQPEYVRNPRPAVSWANVARLWRAAYPEDCGSFPGFVDFE